MNYPDVPIWEKYTLTIEEAAKYFRIGEKSCANWRRKTQTPTGCVNGNRT